MLKRLEGLIEPEVTTESQGSTVTQMSVNRYSWEDFEAEMFPSASNVSNYNLTDLQLKLQELSMKERLPMKTKIIDHWEVMKLSDPHLGELAEIILAAPATQVSVERAFSALALVLSKLRISLSDLHLDMVLILKLNKDLLDRINYEQLN